MRGIKLRIFPTEKLRNKILRILNFPGGVDSMSARFSAPGVARLLICAALLGRSSGSNVRSARRHIGIGLDRQGRCGEGPQGQLPRRRALRRAEITFGPTPALVEEVRAVGFAQSTLGIVKLNPVGSTVRRANGRHVPTIATDQMAAALMQWLDLPDSEFHAVFADLVNFDQKTIRLMRA